MKNSILRIDRLHTMPYEGGRIVDAVYDEAKQLFQFFIGARSSITNFKSQFLEKFGDGPVIKQSKFTANGALFEVALPADSQSTEVIDGAFSRPDFESFQGKNVFLSFCNLEAPEFIIRWLEYHRDFHGLEGALLFCRENNVSLSAKVLKKALKDANLGIDVILVSIDFPIGGAESPREDHPILLAEAPGKDRMEIPENDPELSPLVEGVLFEVARWRYLQNARAVAFLRPSEYLAIPQETEFCESVFDVTVKSLGRVDIDLTRIYPWRIKPRVGPRLGDHICRKFDGEIHSLRYAYRPDALEFEHSLKFIRIPNLSPSATYLGFQCIAFISDYSKISKLVPKTSLVEDEVLLRISKTILDCDPVRPPQHQLAVDLNKPLKNPEVTIVTTMKNEGPFILEWLAYHRSIGVKSFLVYTNDCTDGTDEMFDLLQEKGYLTHRDNPYRTLGAEIGIADLKPQHAAFFAADGEEVVQSADWLLPMDVDEYVNIHVGDGHLDDLFAAIGDANMISLTWRLFGNSDIEHFVDEPIIKQFTMCAKEVARTPHQAWGFKTLYRNAGIFKKLGVHRPNGLKADLKDQIHWVNGSGKPMPERVYRNAWRSSLSTFGYDLVTLNHYAVRSMESFLVKRDRGRVNHVDRDQGIHYWFRMNHNLDEDFRIQRRIPAMQAELDKMLADKEIKAMHEKCVAAHRAKIEELMAREDQQQFYELLNSERMRNISRRLNHFGANVFLQGPESVPDKYIFDDLPDDFYFNVKPPKEANH